MKFKELINYLDGQFPKSLSMPGDIDGVDVCVDYDLEIGRILIVLDITFEIVDYAVTHGYNCIISHHSLIRNPLPKIDLSTSACKKAVELIRNNICAASFHTRLDAVTGGVNDCLINAADITGNIELLYTDSIPIGRLVTLSEETDLQDFIDGVKKSLSDFYANNFSVDADINISYAGGEKKAKKVGIVAGSGLFDAKSAAESGADTFFTGEGKYHDILDAYEFLGMNVITAGHFETEAVVLPFIKQKILEKFPDANADCFVGGHNV